MPHPLPFVSSAVEKRKRAPIALALILTLAACRPAPEDSAPRIDPANPLEVAAAEANLVDDPATTPPSGLYERRHSSGRDALCLSARGDDRYRFGLVASFGATLACRGRGFAEQRGGRLTLAFDDADCTVEASYDGRAVRIAGRVPDGCAALCGPRASISGVGLDRVGWSDEDAATLRASPRSAPMCEG